MIAGIILAAGQSRRMGRPKQLLQWGAEPLIRHVARQALDSRLDKLYVVVGAHAGEVAAALADLPLVLVHNGRYAEGQSTSLRAGIAALPPETSAALIILGDQPLITPALIDALAEEALRWPAPIIAPAANGRRSNPVLFKAALFPELLRVAGDQGARQVIAAHREQVLLLPHPDAGLQADLDTPEDYERLRPKDPDD